MTKKESEEITREFVGGLVKHLGTLIECLEGERSDSANLAAQTGKAKKFLAEWRSRYANMEL